MKNESVGKILDFAIEREKEAAEFYRNLQKDVNFKSKLELLKNLEEMELSHIDILNELKSKNIEAFKSQPVEDLKISDYIVETQDRDDLTYQDILIIAMKKEESAFKLYYNMSQKMTGNESARRVFQKLASEEAKHKKHFEEIYDSEILSEN